MDIVGWWLRKPPKALLATLAHAKPAPCRGTPKRILIVREGGYGDLIVTAPVIRTIRQHLGPDVIIDALVREAVVVTYKDFDQINRLFAKCSKLAQAVRTIRAMRKRRYDLVIDLVSSPSLSFALWVVLAALGAHRVGGDKAELKGMYHQHIDLPPRPTIHFMERLRRIAVQPFGDLPMADNVPWFNWPDDVVRQVDTVWRELVDVQPSGDAPGPVVLINMSAGVAQRTWPDASYQELLPRLLVSHGARVHRWLITAAPHEFQRATDLVAASGDTRVVVLPTQSDFRVVTALAGKMSLTITPDTSFVHACAANGKAVVSFTVADKIVSWAPWKCPHEVVGAAEGEDVSAITVARIQAAFNRVFEKIVPTPSPETRG